MQAIDNEPLKEVALYYPGHLWHSPEWIKTLLLFFDGVALLVPEYKRDELEQWDPTLAIPLRERGMLHYLVADEVIDGEATKGLVTALTQIISSGALDELANDGSRFHEISRSRMGYSGDQELAEILFEQLAARGLARGSEDGVSVPLHATVRYLILVLLAQILRPGGVAMGLDLSPTTDRFRIMQALSEFLELPAAASQGNVVAFDLQVVSADLRSVPLDEVLDFRSQHLQSHRLYTRSVRKFTRELSLLPESERVAAFDDRQAELDDLASDLRRQARTAWKRPASFALGLAGSAWTVATGDPIGALLGVGAAAVGGLGSSGIEAGAFSYLFATHREFS